MRTTDRTRAHARRPLPRPNSLPSLPRRLLLASALPVAALGLGACASEEQASGSAASDGGGAATLDADLHAKAVEAAKSIAGGKELGGSIEYIGPNGGAEGAILQAVYDAFTEATGTAVNYTGSQDTNNIVQSRVKAGNPPAVADLSLGVATGYAKQGKLLDLTTVIGKDELATSYNESLLEAASQDGKLFGVYQGFSNFMLWFNPKEYTGPKDPSDWQEMIDWTDQRAKDGKTTWAIAEESGAGSGFPGAQFIEVLFAKKYGPDLLRKWGMGELAWSSDEVKDAWSMFGSIATDDSKVEGGVTGSLAAPIASGSNGLVDSPDTAQASVWGSWVPGLIGSTVEPGKNLDFMRVPASEAEYEKTEIFQTTVAVGFSDDEKTTAFLKYVASTEAQTLLASADQWTVANTNVPADTYSSELLQRAAKTYFGDDVTLATGPNVLADAATSAAFYKGVMSYLQDPDSLDSVLQGIESAAKDS
jgi:alpha-glucoside transport system substrate-binding protein